MCDIVADCSKLYAGLINDKEYGGVFVSANGGGNWHQMNSGLDGRDIFTLRQAENFGKLAYFIAAENVKWRKPVRPGDTLVIDVELTKARGKVGKAKGVCSVNSEVVSEAEVTFMMAEG